jgi:hypothetical protein
MADFGDFLEYINLLPVIEIGFQHSQDIGKLLKRLVCLINGLYLEPHIFSDYYFLYLYPFALKDIWNQKYSESKRKKNQAAILK